MLKEHDWAYDYSDDSGDWRKGRDSMDAIVTAAHQSPENRALLDLWERLQLMGCYEGPPLSYRGFHITHIGHLWTVSSDKELCCASSARRAVAAIDAHLAVLNPQPLPTNVIPFNKRYQK